MEEKPNVANYDPYDFLKQDGKFVNTLYLIGIGYYKKFTHLASVAPDLEAVENLLSAPPFKYTVVYSPEDKSGEGLRKFLEEELGRRPQLSQGKEERIVIYWISHGEAVGRETGEVPHGYFLPSDAEPGKMDSYLSMQVLYEAIAKRAPHHLLLVLDCCYAASFQGAFATKSTFNLQYWEQFGRCLDRRAWHLLTSASYDEEALDIQARAEAWNATRRNGLSVFCDAFCDGLRGIADRNDKGLIPVMDLYIHIRDRFFEFRAEAITSAEGEEAALEIRQYPQLMRLPRHQDGEFIFPRLDRPKLRPAPDLTEANNPWRGLNAYNSSDEDIELYSGRDEFLGKMVRALQKQPLLFLTGFSGSGKTSFLHAKLKPGLERLGAHSYKVLVADMGNPDPMAALRDVLIGVMDNLEQATTLKSILDWVGQQPQTTVCLVLDQAEGLITARSKQSGEDFMGQIAAALAVAPANFRLLFSLRSDFAIHFKDSVLGARWKEATPNYMHDKSGEVPKERLAKDDRQAALEKDATVLHMPRLTIQELRRCIMDPADRKGLFFEPSTLVDTLVSEVADAPGALPLLSFTLSELYLHCAKQNNKKRTITSEAYQDLGGVIGSVSKKADQLLEDLKAKQMEEMLERIIIRLVAIEGGEWTKRRARGDEFIFEDDHEGTKAQKVLQELKDAGLIVIGSANPHGSRVMADDFHLLSSNVTIDLAHEALIAAWTAVRGWIRKYGEANIVLLHQVADAARAWKDQKGPLWVGRKTRLREALKVFGI